MQAGNEKVFDQAIDLFERSFGRRKAFVSKGEAAEFFSCSLATIERKFYEKFVYAPGGVRISKIDIINAIGA